MKLDIETAKWLVDKMENDRKVFPVAFDICDKCEAAYLPELGHNCKKIIEVTERSISSCGEKNR